jgi:hypothetical protein
MTDTMVQESEYASASADEQAALTDAVPEGAPVRERAKRQVGTIQFPYAQLDDAVEVAKKIWETSGLRAHLDQLAPGLGHDTVKSGAFRSKIGAARLFGLVNTVGLEVSLTDLGQRMNDPRAERAARAEAFLTVPLFRLIYDRYRGRVLPNAAGLEQEMIDLGIAPKQRERARQVLLRSAQQAGFFGAGRDRLVLPPSVTLPSEPTEGAAGGEPVPPAPPAEREAQSMAQHPLIQGLIAKLPPEGESFSAKQIERWLRAARVNLMLIYETDDPETAQVNGQSPKVTEAPNFPDDPG